MAITNDPVVLNGTAAEFLLEMQKKSTILSVLAERKRQQVYGSIPEIADIVRGNSVANNKRLFPVGDMIIAPWRDLDDPDHDGHDASHPAYQVGWHIADHQLVTLMDGSVVPGMFLQMHKCSAYGVQVSNYQAFMNCPEGLAAGTYNIVLGATWGSKDAKAGTQWQFTLRQAVPAGGRLSGFEGMPDQVSTNWRVKSWESPDAASPIETVTVTEGDEGTNLGTMNYTTLSDDGLNCMQRVGYGHNRWATSAIRQYLNSADVNWFSSKENFDIRPNEYAKHGFMAGFNSDFLNAIKPVKVTTALNTVEGYTETTEDTFDTFFLPSLQQMNVTPQLASVEGDAFDYWKRALGSQNFVGTGSANVFDAFKIPAINNNSAQSVRLRSANRGSAHNAWHVDSSGCVSSSGTIHAQRFSPVCVIC